MKILPVDTGNLKETQAFLDLPFRLYADTPQWVPPLEMDARRPLNRKSNPFYRHSDAAFFMAQEGERWIGRIAVLDNRHYNEYNHERTGFFYLFECENHAEAAAGLFQAAEGWVRQHGLNRLAGPKGFTALDGMGLLVEGFEHRPALGIPYNPAYYAGLVEAAGFTSMGETVSGYMHRSTVFPEKVHQAARLVMEKKGLHVSQYRTRSDLYKLVPRLGELYNKAIQGTSGNTPLTDDEAMTLADQILWFADPRLIKIVFKENQPVGFVFAYPDISAALQRTRGRLFPLGWARCLVELRRTKWLNINGAGMIEEYRGLGGTAVLFSELYKTVRQSRYEHVDIVQIGVENERMQNEMRNFGIQFYKKHRLYQKDLVS